MRLNPGSPLSLALSLVLLLLELSTPLMAQQGSVRSELSASTITRDESVTLTVVAEGIDGELDFSALEKDFDVASRSRSRQISTVTGPDNRPLMRSEVTWALELMPRDVGIFTVQAVTVGGLRSQLLTLTVNEVPSGGRRDVFVEATVDSRSPWVQSQVMMSLRVYQAIDIVDGGLSEPSGDALQVQRIGEDSHSREERNGRQYNVTERRFAVFPQKSGTLVIDPVTLSVSVPAEASATRGFFSPTRKLTRRTDPIWLDVQARPPGGAAWLLPASGVTLTGSWSAGSAQAIVGQPLTRSIVMRAGGVMDSQLPDISIPAIEGASLYAEEPVRIMGINERGLVAEQSIKWAVIPQREGRLVLPAVTVEWFNTDTGRFETASLPEEVLAVEPSAAIAQPAPADPLASGDAVPAANAVSTPPPALLPEPAVSSVVSAAMLPEGVMRSRLTALQQSNDAWRRIALGSLALWVGCLVVYLVWRVRRRKLGQSVRQQAQAAYQLVKPLAAVEAACAGEDPAAVRRALLDWSRRRWPARPPLTLHALADRLPPGSARERVRELDASLYSRSQGGEPVMARLRALPAELSHAIGQDVDDSSGVDRLGADPSASHRLPAL